MTVEMEKGMGVSLWRRSGPREDKKDILTRIGLPVRGEGYRSKWKKVIKPCLMLAYCWGSKSVKSRQYDKVFGRITKKGKKKR